ncbi:MAG: hypothetical protein IPM95_15080 [Sphingobacteriales bacterium]|nr:hypothetical protein [Sphingobacteriales bacterium]
MISFFKSQQPTTTLAFLLFFLVIRLPFLLSGISPAVTELESLWGGIGIILPGYPLLNLILAQCCLLLQAIWFNSLFNKADYHEVSSLVPAVYFSMITAAFHQFNLFSVFTIIGFILLAILHMLLIVGAKENNKLESFNLGVLTGIVILLDVHFIFMLPFLLVIFYILSSFRFHHFVLLFFGILFPAYVVVSISYLADIPLKFKMSELLDFHLLIPDFDTSSAIAVGMILSYLLFSFVSLRGIMFSAGIRRRKNVNMLILFFLGALAVVLSSYRQNSVVFSYLILPVSIFLTLLMLRIRKKRLGEILNAIFVLVIFVTNIVRIIK